ncbi:MAG: glutathione S-transferase family protein [Roseibium sp.]|uniref:glutathione S-transferase family protein n=1 Tax=Roseibium sp. TaxID=1936156 RepID=UPI00260B38AA|nr:glutathione S-transferase family protein [Roseibium sp.]MCV0428901.1 glutathione S-transferase family protein [Roseibium sp.]
MPEIEPRDQSLKSLKGLHLWHAGMSSCSQRVRIALAEAGREFESHLINLERGEHATEEYQSIHPNGVVPALVEDGHLYIESVDIIRHISKGNDDLSKSVDADLLKRADAAQKDLKLLTFEFLFRGGPAKDSEEVKSFHENHKNQWLKQFHADFAKGFERDRIAAAVNRTKAEFDHLNDVLSDGRSFLSGKDFSLADIAWIPNVHRFELMRWPFEDTAHLQRWFERISKRSSYAKALVAWENPRARNTLKAYTEKRRQEGTDIRSFGDLRKS